MTILRTASRTSIQLLIVIAVVLILVRISLPHFIKDYVNKTLDRLPEYDGKIEDVSLSLYRGAYTIYGTKIVKTTGSVPVPFFSSDQTDLSVEWRALFQGKVVGEVHLQSPELNFVAGDSKKNEQVSISSEWLQVVKDLFPLRINHFEIENGEVHYRDFTSDPKVDVSINKVSVIAKNFSNTRSSDPADKATLQANGKFEGDADLKIDSQIWPGQKEPTFDAKLSLEELPVKELNDFLRAYGNFDAERGSIGLFSEVKVAKGNIRGYAKPLIKDLAIVRWKTDNDNPLRFVWENIVSVVAEIFSNQSKNQFATNIPFEGSLSSPEVGYWDTAIGIIRNAFVKAFESGFEKGSVAGDEE